jgi:uncharacterized protein (AIM24 family)
MSGSPSRPEPGLFLAHFTKGKQHFEERRYAEAERELEEAYLLKPRDPQVLNLLGIVYFKTEKLSRAEEVYRKLLAESPEAHTLYYNLGLIYMKLNRLEEAEPTFLKALQLSSDNPKIHFYLGSIYERLQRFQDAIYQYRQAGAHLMVRRVEDRISVSGVTTIPKSKTDDTAEFKAKEIRSVLAKGGPTLPPLVPPKPVEPVSPRLMADVKPIDTSATLRPKPRGSDTSPFGLPRVEAAKSAASPVNTLPPVRPPSDNTAPVPPVPRFRLVGRGLIEADFSGKLFIKQGTIYSYSGNLTFWVKEPRGEAPAPLVIVTGSGRLILTDREREVSLIEVDGARIHVDPRHVLALDEGLVPRVVRVGSGDGTLEFLEIEGHGMAALSVSSRPLTLTITPDLPASVPAASVIYWNGNLEPKLVEDQDVFAVMTGAGARPGTLVRLEGSGQLMVEQWLG